MTSNKTVRLVITALFAALTYVATTLIQIPSPMSGYIHLGDGFVLLSGLVLGPFYGGLAAGIGSMLADLLSGYGHYVPGTFVIKFLAAFACGWIFSLLKKRGNVKNLSTLAGIVGGMAGMVIVVIGYFFYSSLFLGKGIAAISSIPGNILQGITGTVVATLLFPVLYKLPTVQTFLEKAK
ncbi:substrate-specific component PdxU2 of predicted pyridoxin-related ECF transporter [Lachnospiraceae bacterium KM106-2]|nr:substrate-specific component PdxU2 of predicted pyridoxin-related ECF transporter [Lachnospiraceae bacterium KM106-2]